MSPPFPLAYVPAVLVPEATVIVLTLALMMTFAGSRVIHWLSFIVTGLLAAYPFALFSNYFLGTTALLPGFALGFALGGTTTVVSLSAGMGLAVGMASFSVAETLISDPFVATLVGVVGFVYGFLLTDLLLPVISAYVGSVLLYGILLTAGIWFYGALLLSFGTAALGVYVQVIVGRRASTLFGEPRKSYRSRRLREMKS